MRGPVERAEKRARRHGGVGGPQLAALDSVGDDGAHAALVAIAFGDDRRAQARRQGIDLEMRRRPFDFIDEAQNVRGGEIREARRQRHATALRRGERGEQPSERAILAEKEELVLAAEVVIQVAGRQIRGDRDVAHAGGGEPLVAKRAGGRFQDVQPAHLGAV